MQHAVAESGGGTALASLVLGPAEFRLIAGRVGAITGMQLNEGKEDLVKARLLKRLRALRLPSFAAYLDYLEGDNGGEWSHLVDVLTTNKTSFFREPEHFEYLRRHILPELPRRGARLWSAACSSGEEPYSLAMLLAEEFPDLAERDLRILATDISSVVLEKAAQAFYPMDTLDGVSPRRLQEHFQPAREGGRHGFQLRPGLASLVRLARLNLMEDWPMQGPFDAVLCRNVMIYFSKATQERLVNRFWRLIRPGGHLLVGHSESLSGLSHPYRYVQPAVYQKTAE